MKKIVSWNVNGLRAVHRKKLWEPFLKELKADIICLQEIKALEEQLPKSIQSLNGYVSYFNPAQNKKGYSGVALYTKTEPITVEYGFGIDTFDQEGRILIAHFDTFILYNIYFPNGGMGPERLKYKMDFYDAFLKHTEKSRQSGKEVIFCGDVNTAHEAIDLARPKANETRTGFLPEERAWLDEVVAHGYTDTFRHFYPTKEDAYTWWDMKTRARDRNVGWRIDYFFATPRILHSITSAKIHTNIIGSDHCPISITIK